MIVLWIVCFTIILAGVFQKLCITSNTKLIVILSWIIRIILVPIDMVTNITRQPDQFMFLGEAERVFSGEIESSVQDYSNLIALAYKIFGLSPLLIKLSNAFIGMLGLAVALHCMRRLSIEGKTYEIVTAMLAFSPITIFISVTALRDPIYYLSVTLSFFYFIKWVQEKRNIDFIITILVLVPSIYLHFGHAVIACVYFAIFFLSRRGKRTNRSIVKIILCLIGFVGLPLVLRSRITGQVSMVLNGSFTQGLISYVSTSNVANSTGNSAYLEGTLDVNSFWQIILYTPLRMLYFLLSPMIWDISRGSDLLAFMTDSVVFIFAGVLFYQLHRKYKKAHRSLRRENPELWLILVSGIAVILAFSVPFGWGTITAGTAIRHRNCLLPLTCLMIAICKNYRVAVSEKYV